MAKLVIRGVIPTTEVVDAIYVAAAALDRWECYAHEGRYHFTLGSGWSIAISADSADRIRVETCRLTRPVSTMWTLPHHPDRLAGLVRKMSTVPEVA